MPPAPDNERHANFLRLYASSEGALHTFVRSLVPTRQMALEVVQDVILVLWNKFEDTTAFQPWAFGVAKKVALQHLRRVSRDRHVFDDDLVHRLSEESAARVEVHDRHREALQNCLQKLPEPQRDLVLSAYAPGVRIDELAAERGQTPMALYKILHRIRQSLLRCVDRTLATEEPS
jgi:RNA polymerase sigma-70 factor (ECF subfamily)